MQRKLAFAFIGFALLPLMVVTWLLLTYTQKNQSLSLAQEAALLIKSEIESTTSERLRDLHAYTLGESLREQNPQQLEVLGNAIVKDHPEYKLVLMVNKEGIVEGANTKDAAGQPLDTAPLLGKSFERSSWFQRALHSDGPVMETPKDPDFLKAILGNGSTSVLPIAQVIRNQAGEITAVWVIFCSAEYLNEVIKSVGEKLKAKGRFEIFDHGVVSLANYSNDDMKGDYETATELFQFAGQTWYIKCSVQEENILEQLKIYFWPLLVFLGLIIMYAFVAARRLTIPLSRLIDSAEALARGQTRVDVPYKQRKDDYGRLARVLKGLQPAPAGDLFGSATQLEQAKLTAQSIDNAVDLINGLSAQANILALNATMEAVNAHHLDPVAEKANELAQITSYNSSELLKKLQEIRAVCEEIQSDKTVG